MSEIAVAGKALRPCLLTTGVKAAGGRESVLLLTVHLLVLSTVINHNSACKAMWSQLFHVTRFPSC
jgi:hypothetical protein